MLFQIEEKKATLLVFVLFLRLRETMFPLATAVAESQETLLRVNVTDAVIKLNVVAKRGDI